MPRVSIYISEDLKARMDEVEDAINWSEVARPAFQSAIANFQHRRTRNMDTAIERLRASKQDATKNDIEAGREAGRDWAGDFAEYAELARLSKTDLDGNYAGAWDVLKHAISPDDGMSHEEILEYCFGEEEPDSDEYVGGFVEGAQELFDEIKDQL